MQSGQRIIWCKINGESGARRGMPVGWTRNLLSTQLHRIAWQHCLLFVSSTTISVWCNVNHLEPKTQDNLWSLPTISKLLGSKVKWLNLSNILILVMRMAISLSFFTIMLPLSIEYWPCLMCFFLQNATQFSLCNSCAVVFCPLQPVNHWALGFLLELELVSKIYSSEKYVDQVNFL